MQGRSIVQAFEGLAARSSVVAASSILAVARRCIGQQHQRHIVAECVCVRGRRIGSYPCSDAGSGKRQRIFCIVCCRKVTAEVGRCSAGERSCIDHKIVIECRRIRQAVCAGSSAGVGYCDRICNVVCSVGLKYNCRPHFIVRDVRKIGTYLVQLFRCTIVVQIQCCTVVQALARCRTIRR